MDMARPADPGLHTGWVSSGGAGAGGFGEKRRGWPALDDRPLKVPRGLLGRPEDLGSGAGGDPPDALGCPHRTVAGAASAPWGCEFISHSQGHQHVSTQAVLSHVTVRDSAALSKGGPTCL